MIHRTLPWPHGTCGLDVETYISRLECRQIIAYWPNPAQGCHLFLYVPCECFYIFHSTIKRRMKFCDVKITRNSNFGIHKVPLEHSEFHLLTYCLWLLLRYKGVELLQQILYVLTLRAWNIYCLGLYSTHFVTSTLDRCIHCYIISCKWKVWAQRWRLESLYLQCLAMCLA